MRSIVMLVDCGSFGHQEFTCYFDDNGHLDAAYAWMDREEKINCRPEMDEFSIKALESDAAAIFEESNEGIRKAKVFAEERMIAQDAYEGAG